MGRRGVLLLIVAFVIGGVVGYALPGDGDRRVGRPARPPSTDPALDRPGEDQHALLSWPVAPGESAPPLPVVFGSGRITGFVRTASGVPLPGAVVRAQLQVKPRVERRHTTGVPPDPDLSRSIRELVDRQRLDVANRREATTGADGSYSIEGLADGRDYSLDAYRKSYRIWRLPGARSRFRSGDSCDFTA